MQFGTGVEAFRSWVEQAAIDVGVKPGRSSEDAEPISELERKIQ